jgi:predicted transcriptional regulator
MLLSINPQHVKNILNGSKKYEYRKVRCRSEVKKMLIYSTSPVMRVVAEAEIIDVIEGNPENVWNKTFLYSGIQKEFFDNYYLHKGTAIAYQLGQIREFDKPIFLSDLGINSAPQSFVYID